VSFNFLKRKVLALKLIALRLVFLIVDDINLATGNPFESLIKVYYKSRFDASINQFSTIGIIDLNRLR
jgi:hypothetical protein